MDAAPRTPGEARFDPMDIRPDCGAAGDFARWEAAREADDRRETDAEYDEHRRKFIDAGGRASKFDALNLMAAARLTAARLLNGLRLGRGVRERKATEREIRGVLSDLARGANEARADGRLRLFRRRLWPFGETPPRRCKVAHAKPPRRPIAERARPSCFRRETRRKPLGSRGAPPSSRRPSPNAADAPLVLCWAREAGMPPTTDELIEYARATIAEAIALRRDLAAAWRSTEHERRELERRRRELAAAAREMRWVRDAWHGAADGPQ